jgi:hypothetical protein
MDLKVRIEKGLPPIVPGAISFETGASRANLDVPDVVAYEHHGKDFTIFDRGALPAFYEDLLLGRAMPVVFATPSIQDIDTLLAIALFLHRDLATHPATTSFVYTVDFVHRHGLPALAHIDADLARFLSALRTHFPDKGLSQRETSARLTQAIGWLREHIHEGQLPVLGAPPRAEVRILDHGTTGFVVAETTESLWDGWVELFRAGFLRGILIDSTSERKRVLIARKSPFLPFDLALAARILNQMETAMGELPDWVVRLDGLWLEGPSDGTLILLQDILNVLVRM